MVLLGLTGSEDLRFFEQRKSYFEIKDNARVIFSENTRIGMHFSILCAGKLEFGKNFSSNNGCVFSCMNSIRFGEDVLLGGHITVRDSEGHVITVPDYNNTKSAEVVVGNHVWICNKADLLNSAKIADNTVIAYRSLCKKSYPPNVLIAGLPARIVRKNITWEK